MISGRSTNQRRTAYPSLLPILLLLTTTAWAASTGADSTVSGVAVSALWRSAVLPGWGQFYNDRPVKGTVVGAGALVLMSSGIAEHRSMNRAYTATDRELRAERRNVRFLFLGLLATFAAMDAYVDAHLWGFGTETDLELAMNGTDVSVNLIWVVAP